MENQYIVWGSFAVLIIALLIFDLGVLNRRNHEIKVKESLFLSLFYFVFAMCFAAGIFYKLGPQSGYEFLTGYLIELSLSFDNLFVFVLIFTYFGVPAKYQHRVLFWGILGALIMRGVFISGGIALIHHFEWIIYIFGGFLVITGVKMFSAADETPDLANNKLVKFMRKHLRTTDDYQGDKFFVRKGKKLWFTPLFLVLVLVEFSDVIFALDSIPAIFAVTRDPLIVYTSNIFAILGLRSLYFLMSYIVHRFEYLKYGLSFILVIIGCKMIANEYFGEKIIPTEIALACTFSILIISIIISLIKTRNAPKSPVSGWVPGSDGKEEIKKNARKLRNN